MNRMHPSVWLVMSLALASLGCHWSGRPSPVADSSGAYYEEVATQIEFPFDSTGSFDDPINTPPPLTVEDLQTADYRDLTLEETLRIALSNSKVLRDLGGRLLEAPLATRTVHDPAIRATDPLTGEEAALSGFDTVFSAGGFHEKNDRSLNNRFFGGGTTVFLQDTSLLDAEIRKRAVTGGEFSVRHQTDYDANNAPGNTFPSSWNTALEAEFRQPLLLGAGSDFNRIVGANLQPGQANGILVARVNTDVSLADFELAVIKFTNNVENAYWDLYFSYRDLSARVAARDGALLTWKKVQAIGAAGSDGEEKEAQAREQYYRFQEAVENALTGRLVERTRDNNGSRAGTFRGVGGVHVAERRLRLMMGLPINGQNLLRPIEDPLTVRIQYDWAMAVAEALERRAELRRQRWVVERRELELAASEKFLLPQFDAIGRYRWRGFGKNLFQQHGGPRFDNAWEDLTTGDFQEWQLGAELTFPIGYRQGHAAVRNAELRLARARSIEREQEREVVHELSNAVAEMHRAYRLIETTLNRRIAAKHEADVLQEKFNNELINDLDLVLDSQRRATDAEVDYYRARIEYAMAIKNVHLSKGSLLDVNHVYLNEGTWPAKAYADAMKRLQNRTRPLTALYDLLEPTTIVSQGPIDQVTMPTEHEQPAMESAEDATAVENADESTLPPTPEP